MSGRVHSVLELFSVELWREVFDYFDANDLWYSFRGLNRKIDAIIDKTILHLNFNKQDNYRYFVERILPSMDIVNVRSLKFQKPNEIKDFFSKYSLNSLLQLRLLSLTFMYSFNDNSFPFWNQLSSLKYLQFLKIKLWGNSGPDNCIEEKEFIIRSIFNNDYCPSLKSFIITPVGRSRGRSMFPSLITTTKTTNIEYLSIDSMTFNDMIKLVPALQNVKSICVKCESCYDKESNNQQQNMTTTMPLMPKCSQLNIELPEEITFAHVEYFLKHTPNLKDLFLWGWDPLLNAAKWQMLLSVYCPKLLKFELLCTGRIGDDDFEQAIDDFEQECQTTPFWLERNVSISDEDRSAHDYRYEAVVRFNIKNQKTQSNRNE